MISKKREWLLKLSYTYLDKPDIVGYNNMGWYSLSYVLSLIADEQLKMTLLKENYEKQLTHFPKGSLRIRTRGGNEYYYLSHRDGKKVITDYVGKDKLKITELREQMERRKHKEDILREITKELAVMKKLSEGAK